MQNLDITTVIPLLFGALVLLIIFLVIVNRIFVNVGAREIAIKERRYLGAKMPPEEW
jgi:cell division protein FtsX